MGWTGPHPGAPLEPVPPPKKVDRFHFGRAHHLPVADKGTRCGATSSSFLFAEGIQPAPHGLLPHSRRKEPSQMCSPCSLQAHWQRSPPFPALGVCAGASCQVTGSPGDLPSPSDSCFLSGSGIAGADARALRPIRVILCQVRQDCLFGGVLFVVVVFYRGIGFPPPTLSCLAGLLPWPGCAGGGAQESVSANDKCNSV